MNKKKILFSIFITIFGIIFRIFLNTKVGIPNFEAVTALSLISGSFFGGIYGPLISVSIIFFSDLYFGNNFILFFTWSAFILIGAFGSLIKRNSRHYLPKIIGSGIASVLFFYLWTNFGWWLISGMYPMGFQGLIQSYIAAIPFLKNQLTSVLIFTPLFVLVFSFLSEKVFKFKKEAIKYENIAFVSKIS